MSLSAFSPISSSPVVIDGPTLQTDCDGYQSRFFCPAASGTCYTNALDGWIGCCSTTDCLPRTTCIEYSTGVPSSFCDSNSGGCLTCSESTRPFCYTVSNIEAQQYIFYCNEVRGMRLTSYANIAPPGSIYTPGQIATAPTPTPTSRNRSLPSVGPTASFNPSATAGKKSVSSGAIAGITAGCIAGIAALASLVWFLWRRQQRSRTSRSSPRSQSTHGGVGGAVVPEKQTQESNGMGWFQRKRYYSTQEGQGTRKPELNEHNMDDNGKIIPADATTSTRQDTSQANAGLGITAHRSSPPFSPASFHPASCNTNGFSITNGPPSPLPPSSTVDGRFNTDVGSAAPALELESRQQIVEADTVAGAAGGGALSPPTPRTVNNRGSQYTTAGASMLAPSVSGTISPPSDSPNLGQSRQPSQGSPPSAYQAYRIAQGDGVGRGPSLTSATGYTGFKYASPEDMMQHGWKNDPEPE